MAQTGDAPSAAPSASTPPETAVDVLRRVIEEQRRAEAALQSRFLEHGLIDQAIGVLAARLECDPKDAFDQLLEIERRSGRDLLEVAAELVGQQTRVRARVPMGEAVPVYGPGVVRLQRSADSDELARLLLGDTLAWSGPAQAAIALLEPDGALELIGSGGLPPRVVSQWRRIPPQVNCLLTACLREQDAVWADAGAVKQDAGRSFVLGPVGAGGGASNPLHVAVPLRIGRGLIGAVEVGWPAGTTFTPEVRRELVALIESAAQAVVRARRLQAGCAPSEERDAVGLDGLRELIDATWEPALLVEGERGEGEEPAQDGDVRPLPFSNLRVVALNAAARELISGGVAAPDPIGRRLTEQLPWIATSGAFDAIREVLATGTTYRDPDHTYTELDGNGRRRSIAISATRLAESLLYVALRPAAAQRGDEGAVAARLRRMAETGSWEWDAASRVVHWSSEALMAFGSRIAPGPVPEDRPPYAVHPDDQLEHDRLMRTLMRGGRPAQGEFRVVRPDGAVRHIRVAGEPITGHGGAVTSVFGTVQDVTEQRRAQTALEIAHIQLAAQRSRAESERQLATLLQQVIMPVEPLRVPHSAGLEIAARYRPASPAAGLGGDWYGVLPLPDSRLLLTVGDIAGHGFAAATAMAQLFHALHGLALTGSDSGQLLRWLNGVTCSLPTFTLASACAALYDPERRQLCVANAGHPSPVLVRSGRAATIERPAGTMLGVDPNSRYDETSLSLEPGDVLLLYTDGLIERRRHSPEENTARLLAEASSAEPDLEAYVDRILQRIESDTDDDTCILAVRFN
ncbi:SpoIIE family protein phosphatase [Actinocrinis puniceicyclus]|uniref:SpoIIE family protein phosphatase n=1 Tax=Actinocrinis puniceicyclus TaxID=977794 RepID=A0A8J7WSA9_9ACTN|nr:SpoIIE family protein phosphatase [Actinocrinis puniceicyclus]MBS2965072.1 SpoIIE family protein phosphatase [Actinocrinis puniceicyclus]